MLSRRVSRGVIGGLGKHAHTVVGWRKLVSRGVTGEGKERHGKGVQNARDEAGLYVEGQNLMSWIKFPIY